VIRWRLVFWGSVAMLGLISAARHAGAQGYYCGSHDCSITCGSGLTCGGMFTTVPSDLDRAEAACDRHQSTFEITGHGKGWVRGWEACVVIQYRYDKVRQAERDAEAAVQAKQDADDLALIEKLTKP
jgi:hypothetical protein